MVFGFLLSFYGAFSYKTGCLPKTGNRTLTASPQRSGPPGFGEEILIAVIILKVVRQEGLEPADQWIMSPLL